MKLKRKGCPLCGRFVMDLDYANATLRRAAGAYTVVPTQRNRFAAEKAKARFAEAKRLHDEHMAEHAAKDNE